jgi:hypothetical protein
VSGKRRTLDERRDQLRLQLDGRAKARRAVFGEAALQDLIQPRHLNCLQCELMRLLVGKCDSVVRSFLKKLRSVH